MRKPCRSICSGRIAAELQRTARTHGHSGTAKGWPTTTAILRQAAGRRMIVVDTGGGPEMERPGARGEEAGRILPASNGPWPAGTDSRRGRLRPCIRAGCTKTQRPQRAACACWPRDPEDYSLRLFEQARYGAGLGLAFQHAVYDCVYLRWPSNSACR